MTKEGRRHSSVLLLGVVLIFLVTQGARGHPRNFYQSRLWNQDERRYTKDMLTTYNAARKHSSKLEASAAETSMEKDSEKIHFPDELQSDVRVWNETKHWESNVPSCKGKTFCEDLPYYPEHLVQKAIKENQKLKTYASVDMVSDIAQRIGGVDDSPLCLAVERVVYPKSAQNMYGDWMYVVNQPELQQGIRVETCMEEGTTCKMIEGFAEGYVSTCEQKYIYRQLAAVAMDGSVQSEMFRFPTSCCCHVKFAA